MGSTSSGALLGDHLRPSEAKRRKLRKGTHSCWECKVRKMRCVFPPLADAITCYGCQRRGCRCVGQEVSEELFRHASMHKARNMDDGGNRGSTTNRDAPTLTSDASEPSYRHLTFYGSKGIHASAVFSKDEKLSRFLHASLPSQEDTERICNASHHPSILPYEIMTTPYADLDGQSGLETRSDLRNIPGPTVHPVLIARYMLRLATVILHLQPDRQHEIEGLSESPREIMERLAHLSISLVTTNDILLGSIEGLECVIIESVYQSTKGNLRRSWLSCRRAMGIAQLMGLNRSDHRAQYRVLQPNEKHHPQLLWFRIVYLDRLLSLMLGMSQGSLDPDIASEAILADETPLGRLERTHCAIASRILARNESCPTSRDDALTPVLDAELQRAARSLPSKWWLIPKLNIGSSSSSTLFWDTRQLFAQVVHYNLLNQLHLPYMLRSSSAERQCVYSRITCINASREIVSRFISLHSINGISYSCRIVDFLTLMAAMTLLLAHLDSHRWAAENLLSHQYYSDRAMVEQVQETMEEVHRLSADSLSAQSADLLRRLLAIDADTPSGHLHGGRRVSVLGTGIETAPPNGDDDAVLNVHVPYFGIIKISHEGISKEVTGPQISASRHPESSRGAARSGASSGANIHPEIPTSRSKPIGSNGAPHAVPAINPVNAGFDRVETPLLMSDHFTETSVQLGTPPDSTTAVNEITPPQANLFDPFTQYSEYPGLAASGEDWTFQGIDLAFFETLMSGGNMRDEGEP